MSNMKKVFSLLTILILISTYISGDVVALVPSTKVGVVGAANKNVSAFDSQSSKRVLELGNDIFFSERITTDAHGTAQLLFLDKSALTVGPNSSLVIDRFVYNPTTSSGQLVINGTKGLFRFIGGALSKKRAVQIKTPVGTIGIRGGIVIVEIAPNGVTNATFVYGQEMTVQNLAGDIQRTTNPGFAISMISATIPPTPAVRVAPRVLAQNISNLDAKKGTTGGAKAVTKKQIKQIKQKISKDLHSEDPAGGDDGGGPFAEGEKVSVTKKDDGTVVMEGEDGMTITKNTDGTFTMDDTDGEIAGHFDEAGDQVTHNPDGTKTMEGPGGIMVTMNEDGTYTVIDPHGNFSNEFDNNFEGDMFGGPDGPHDGPMMFGGGMTETQNADGTFTRTFPDGGSETFDPKTNTVTFIDPEGGSSTYQAGGPDGGYGGDMFGFGDDMHDGPMMGPDGFDHGGMTVVENADGTVTNTFSDGSTETFDPKTGYMTRTNADGSTMTHDPNGITTFIDADGNTKTMDSAEFDPHGGPGPDGFNDPMFGDGGFDQGDVTFTKNDDGTMTRTFADGGTETLDPTTNTITFTDPEGNTSTYQDPFAGGMDGGYYDGHDDVAMYNDDGSFNPDALPDGSIKNADGTYSVSEDGVSGTFDPNTNTFTTTDGQIIHDPATYYADDGGGYYNDGGYYDDGGYYYNDDGFYNPDGDDYYNGVIDDVTDKDYIDENGTYSYVTPDGSKVTVDPNGITTIIHPDGTTTTFDTNNPPPEGDGSSQFVDADNDGIDDNTGEQVPPSDGGPQYVDADGDGIDDNTGEVIPPPGDDGGTDFVDVDNDGIDDSIDDFIDADGDGFADNPPDDPNDPPAGGGTFATEIRPYLYGTALITGQELVLSENLGKSKCQSCSFINWGVLPSALSNQSPGGSVDFTSSTSLIDRLFLTGQPMIVGNLPSGIEATYSGPMIGLKDVEDITNGADIESFFFEDGSLTVTVDMDARKITNLSATFAGLSANDNSGILLSFGDDNSLATFSFGLTGTAGGENASSGLIEGGLYGGSAENIGGSFNFSSTTGNEKVERKGVFLTKQDSFVNLTPDPEPDPPAPTTMIFNNGPHGALEDGTGAAFTIPSGATFQYNSWGAWDQDITNAGFSPGSVSAGDFAQIPIHIKGIPTLVGSMPSGVTGTYNGVMIGSETINGSIPTFHTDGSFNVQVDMSARQLSNFTGNFAGINITNNGGIIQLPTDVGELAQFNSIAVTGQGTMAGHIGGALFGPNAEAIGGSFELTGSPSGDTVDIKGVYTGTRP